MSYIRFEALSGRPGQTTSLVAVVSVSRGDRLGTIGWYGPWRCYVFAPFEGTVWSDGCLADVRTKVANLNAEQRASAARRRERAVAT